MYHRVHSPVDGRIRAWRYVPGRLFPVNGAGVRSIPGLFTRNERVCLFYDTEAHGRAAVVLVGAANVGRMSLAFSGPGHEPRGAAPRASSRRSRSPVVARGRDRRLQPRLDRRRCCSTTRRSRPPSQPGELVRMGQPLWRRS